MKHDMLQTWSVVYCENSTGRRLRLTFEARDERHFDKQASQVMRSKYKGRQFRRLGDAVPLAS